MSSAVALAVDRPAKPRARACSECGHLRSLLAELRAACATLSVVVCAVMGVQRAERIRARREAEPLADVSAERIVLGIALELAELFPSPSAFVGPTHRELAVAIRTGELAPILLTPELRGYRRGLRRLAQRCSFEQKRAACEALMDAVERRAAIAATERALEELRGWAPPADAARELRRALAALGTGEVAEPW